eukprot:9909460-Karenia_brevis.AAC.1
MHACSVNELPKALISKFRTTVLRAIWGRGRCFCCKEVVFTLLTRGHQLDPGQRLAYDSLLTFHKMISTRPALRKMLLETFTAAMDKYVKPVGPVTRLKSLVRNLGWAWPQLTSMQTDEGQLVDLTTVSIKSWQHVVREGLRRAKWREAAARRRDMEGIDAG